MKLSMFMKVFRLRATAIAIAMMIGFTIAASSFGSAESIESVFRDSVQPFVQKNCVACHDSETRQGDLDLTADQDVASVTRNFRHWMVVLDRLRAGDMPPEDAEVRPTESERAAIIDWIERVKQTESERTAGDPGIVPARRLSSAEYNRTIRDLIGHDIRPAAAFPIDPANEAGFDNSAESLAMSPALLRKYLQAARYVADHMVMTPTGITFAPHPVVTDTDRDKFCVNRIIEFYQRQNVDYADYLMVLWRLWHQHDGDGSKLDDLAKRAGVSKRYARRLWDEVIQAEDAVGPIAEIRTRFQALPADGEAAAQKRCQQIAEFIVSRREALIPEVANLTAPEINNGSQALVLWKNRQFVANRRRSASDDQPGLDAFCDLFPDAFFVSERARVYLDPKKEKKLTGRLLSAGFHSQMGYFRDDGPLCDLMLERDQLAEIDRLWDELDFVTDAPARQYAGFIWFDRTDSGFMRDRQFDLYRAEDKDCTSEEKVRGLEAAYTEKAERVGASEQALEAMHRYFDDMSKTFRRLEKQRVASESLHLAALVQWTERAFRRPLTQAQRDEVTGFYRMLRTEDGLSHDEAIRDTWVRVLVSPNFCYRIDRVTADDSEIAPLDDHSLANRLSYFLWSGMPDDRLLAEAEAGNLLDRNSDAIVDQAMRMIRDARVQGFVTEFAGHWLDFRRFEQHNGVDRDRFGTFDDQLRQSMYEEPLRFIEDVIQRDGSVLEFLDADHTWVDGSLAEHYGIVDPSRPMSPSSWVRWEQASEHGRGGLLGMAVFMTAQSPGLRTSPVKRGNWVVKSVLGEHIPAPPAAVPELPEDENDLGDLTLREALARHRADPSCAACHDRIDSFGLVFEAYGPIGQLRQQDGGGRAIDDAVEFPDGSRGTGLAGLKDYIRRQRQDDFIENLCRKMLAFGLGRTLQLSDEQTIAAMKQNLARDDYRFSSLIQTIVTSPAFLNKRTTLQTPGT